MNTEQFQNGGIWVPAEKNDSDWTIVALHGSGGSAYDFTGLEEIFKIPELNYLYLNGPIKSYSSFRWYDDNPQTRHEAFRMLTQSFETLKQRGYPPEKCFLMGFSQGGALTFEFGVRYPHLLAGYISISGRVEGLLSLFNEGNEAIIKKGEWLVTHGKKDFNLSIDIMRGQVEQMRERGFHIEFQEYDKIHEFDVEEELPYIASWIRQRVN